MSGRKFTALLLAGERPGGDPFAKSQGVAAKALIAIGGAPMIVHPLAALTGSRRIEQVLVLTQRPERIAPVLEANPKWALLPSKGTIAETLLALGEGGDVQWPMLVTTADHALLTTAMVDQFASQAEGADLALAVVTRSAFRSRFPDNRRTWIGFRGGRYTGANLFALGSPKALAAVRLWRGIEQDRKKGWRLLLALGWPGLLGLLRLRTLDQTLAAVARKFGMTATVVRMNDPRAAIDVDKAADLALAERLMARR
ncbi:NTP transferase domain-containing protein [Sphingomonas mesophila]|uniref:NTP transferase domain-containing protein n=1 Tax=Sphingomonas mesophila TaxID=2303576 RepID=UPI0013C31524|nr:NTP transferase domain-containing protein [Sphingomonas mesophila]